MDGICGVCFRDWHAGDGIANFGFGYADGSTGHFGGDPGAILADDPARDAFDLFRD